MTVYIFPTETSYALGCDARSELAVKRIYALKDRSFNLPLLVLVNGYDMLWYYAEKPSVLYQSVLSSHWPGPLTVILKSNERLAANLHKGCRRIAFRYTSCLAAQQLITQYNVPFVGTSANKTGQSPAHSVQDAEAIFGDAVDYYIDGGESPGGKPSTLIDLSNPTRVRYLREGVIPFNALRSSF